MTASPGTDHHGPFGQIGPAAADGGDCERIGQIGRLYMIVHRRAPDPGGLAAYVRELRAGRTLCQLAAEFLESAEFTARVPRESAAAEIWRNAMGDLDAPPPPAGRLAEDVAMLVTSQTVRSRLKLLASLYPAGIPLTEATGYRLWLTERPKPAALPTPPPTRPAVSFIMPISDRVPSAHLTEAIAAFLAQPKAMAELVIVVRGWMPRGLRRMIAGRPGITCRFTPPWCDDAMLLERGLALTTAALVVVIDADGRLDPRAAGTLAAAGEAADIVLADEDRLDAAGLRHMPLFGSAWDPERVMASGQTGVVAMRTALVRNAGGLRTSMWRDRRDLLLRVAGMTEPDRIRHVPAILFSRRSTPTEPFGDMPRTANAIPKTLPRVSLVIPTRDRADLLHACVQGLLHRTDYPDIELVIVDNGSSQPEAVRLLGDLAGDPRVSVLARPGAFNWSALNNAGVAAAHGEVAVLLNNDIEVIAPDWLRQMVEQAVRPEVGAVGAKLLYPDGRVQHAGVVLGPAGRGTHVWRFSAGDAPGYLDLLRVARQVSAVTGACLAIRTSVYEAAGGCDEALRVTWNDVDLCLRVRALGLQVVWTPHARLLHREQASRGSDDTPERLERFRREQDHMRTRWGAAIDRDPFWNPNLRPGEGPDEVEPRLAVD